MNMMAPIIDAVISITRKNTSEMTSSSPKKIGETIPPLLPVKFET